MDMNEPERASPSDILGPQVVDKTRPQMTARIALAAVLVGLGAWTLRSYIPALVWSVVLAIAIWPLLDWARCRLPPGKHGVLVPALFTVAIGLVFVVPLALVVIEISREAHDVGDWVTQARTQGIPAPAVIGRLPIGALQASAWWQANLADPKGSEELLGRIDRGWIVSVSREVGSQLVHRVVLFAFTLVALFFLFRDGRSVTAQVLTASRKAFGPRGERIGRQMVASVRGTVNGLVLVGLGEGALLGLAYVFAGVPHPALFGALTAVAAMVPMGAPLVFGVAALLLLAKGSTTAAIVVFVFGMVVASVADHAIRPALIGGTTRLPFLWVLLGILGGVETWGLLGLFVGPAIMAALILLWREWTCAAPA